MVNDFSDEKI